MGRKREREKEEEEEGILEITTGHVTPENLSFMGAMTHTVSFFITIDAGIKRSRTDEFYHQHHANRKNLTIIFLFE